MRFQPELATRVESAEMKSGSRDLKNFRQAEIAVKAIAPALALVWTLATAGARSAA